MWSIKETNNVRQNLKNKLTNYSWYHNSYVIPDFEGYAIMVEVTRLDEDVKKVIPNYYKYTNIKIQLRNKNYSTENDELL